MPVGHCVQRSARSLLEEVGVAEGHGHFLALRQQLATLLIQLGVIVDKRAPFACDLGFWLPIVVGV